MIDYDPFNWFWIVAGDERSFELVAHTLEGQD
jgi:hypothetical protein